MNFQAPAVETQRYQRKCLYFFFPLGILIIDSNSFAFYDLWRLGWFRFSRWGMGVFSSLPGRCPGMPLVQHAPPVPWSDSAANDQEQHRGQGEPWVWRSPVTGLSLEASAVTTNRYPPIQHSWRRDYYLDSEYHMEAGRNVRNQELENGQEQKKQQEGTPGIRGSWWGAWSTVRGSWGGRRLLGDDDGNC